eukprot:m51a1_g775 hypothetical protein (1328) ;mRNA; f:586352-593579
MFSLCEERPVVAATFEEFCAAFKKACSKRSLVASHEALTLPGSAAQTEAELERALPSCALCTTRTVDVRRIARGCQTSPRPCEGHVCKCADSAEGVPDGEIGHYLCCSECLARDEALYAVDSRRREAAQRKRDELSQRAAARDSLMREIAFLRSGRSWADSDPSTTSPAPFPIAPAPSMAAPPLAPHSQPQSPAAAWSHVPPRAPAAASVPATPGHAAPHALPAPDRLGILDSRPEEKERVKRLIAAGLWRPSLPPRVPDPPRLKSHWDCLLQEAVWLSADFAGERRWKAAAASALARAVAQRGQVAIVARRTATEALRRESATRASTIVNSFWTTARALATGAPVKLMAQSSPPPPPPEPAEGCIEAAQWVAREGGGCVLLDQTGFATVRAVTELLSSGSHPHVLVAPFGSLAHWSVELRMSSPVSAPLVCTGGKVTMPEDPAGLVVVAPHSLEPSAILSLCDVAWGWVVVDAGDWPSQQESNAWWKVVRKIASRAKWRLVIASKIDANNGECMECKDEEDKRTWAVDDLRKVCCHPSLIAGLVQRDGIPELFCIKEEHPRCLDSAYLPRVTLRNTGTELARKACAADMCVDSTKLAELSKVITWGCSERGMAGSCIAVTAADEGTRSLLEDFVCAAGIPCVRIESPFDVRSHIVSGPLLRPLVVVAPPSGLRHYCAWAARSLPTIVVVFDIPSAGTLSELLVECGAISQFIGGHLDVYWLLTKGTVEDAFYPPAVGALQRAPDERALEAAGRVHFVLPVLRHAIDTHTRAEETTEDAPSQGKPPSPSVINDVEMEDSPASSCLQPPRPSDSNCKDEIPLFYTLDVSTEELFFQELLASNISVFTAPMGLKQLYEPELDDMPVLGTGLPLSAAEKRKRERRKERAREREAERERIMAAQFAESAFDEPQTPVHNKHQRKCDHDEEYVDSDEEYEEDAPNRKKTKRPEDALFTPGRPHRADANAQPGKPPRRRPGRPPREQSSRFNSVGHADEVRAREQKQMDQIRRPAQNRTPGPMRRPSMPGTPGQGQPGAPMAPVTPWTPEEDYILWKAVQEHGTASWFLVSDIIAHTLRSPSCVRSRLACTQRYTAIRESPPQAPTGVHLNSSVLVAISKVHNHHTVVEERTKWETVVQIPPAHASHAVIQAKYLPGPPRTPLDFFNNPRKEAAAAPSDVAMSAPSPAQQQQQQQQMQMQVQMQLQMQQLQQAAAAAAAGTPVGPMPGPLMQQQSARLGVKHVPPRAQAPGAPAMTMTIGSVGSALPRVMQGAMASVKPPQVTMMPPQAGMLQVPPPKPQVMMQPPASVAARGVQAVSRAAFPGPAPQQPPPT